MIQFRSIQSKFQTADENQDEADAFEDAEELKGPDDEQGTMPPRIGKQSIISVVDRWFRGKGELKVICTNAWIAWITMAEVEV
jgi:hypothetical protein